jgi:hypothetical protein
MLVNKCRLIFGPRTLGIAPASHLVEAINSPDTEVARKNNDTLSRAADVMYHLKEPSDRYIAKNRILR